MTDSVIMNNHNTFFGSVNVDKSEIAVDGRYIVLSLLGTVHSGNTIFNCFNQLLGDL